MTKFARENEHLIAAAADEELDEYRNEYGADPALRICSVVDLDNVPASLRQLEPFFKTPEAFAVEYKRESDYFKRARKTGWTPPCLEKTYRAFWRYNRGVAVGPWLKSAPMASVALRHEIARLLRHAENRARREVGLPHVGEGWVSEMHLLARARDALADLEVIHHGRPDWLGRQHVDIWIPQLSLAIEYQGEQHDQPIEHFGGDAALLTRRELDARKAELCTQNSCTLIEVRPGYDWPRLRDNLLRIAGGR